MRRSHNAPRIATSPVALLSLALLCCVPLLAPASAARAEPPANPVVHYAGPPWLGFVADRKSTDALKIAAVLKQSPAQQAGIKIGDVLLTVDEAPVKDVRSLKLAMRDKKPGDTLAITLMRDKKPHALTLTLAPTPTQEELIRSQLMGEPAPAFTLDLASKKSASKKSDHISLKSLEGKPTIVEFWATWCQPCEPFKAALSEVHERHGAQVHIVAISNESVDTLRESLEEHPLPYLVASDTEERAHDVYFVRALPLVLVLDESHHVRKVITGRDDPALIEKTISSMLAKGE